MRNQWIGNVSTFVSNAYMRVCVCVRETESVCEYVSVCVRWNAVERRGGGDEDWYESEEYKDRIA